MAFSTAQRAPSFLERLEDDEREALIKLGSRTVYAEHAVLMLQGEVEERLIVLLSGRAKVTRSAGGEHELLLAICDAGELLGELSLIDGLPRLASVSALEPVEALVLASADFRAHLQRTPRVALALLEAVAARFREANVKRFELSASDTLGRLAARVVELADRYGEPEGGALAIAMPISQEELASWTGASRAGVAQALQTMRELGWLSTERRRLLVHDLAALRQRAA